MFFHYSSTCLTVVLVRVSVLCASTVVASVVDAQHFCDSCPYNVDGQCLSRPSTYGFYATQWRRWPSASVATSVAGASRSPLLDVLPPSVIPNIDDEASQPQPDFGSSAETGSINEQTPMESDSENNDRGTDPFLDDPSPAETDGATGQVRQKPGPPFASTWPARIGKGPIATRIRRGPIIENVAEPRTNPGIRVTTFTQAEPTTDQPRASNPLRRSSTSLADDAIGGRTDQNDGRDDETAAGVFEPTLTLISQSNVVPRLRRNPLR